MATGITFITPVEITPGSAGAWTDADVSASIPAGATGVILHFVNTHATTVYTLGARKNGSTDNRIPNLDATTHCWGAIGVDGNRILELYVEDTTNIDVYLVGYFQAESVFFTNAVDKSLSATATWTDIDISADTSTDTALQAIFEIKSTALYYFGLRQNGSTDARIAAVSFHDGFGVIIGVDGSEICEGYIQNAGVDFFLVGYIISDVTNITNATNLSLAGTAEWTDLTALPAGAVGGWIEVISPGANYNYGLRENGSAEDIYRGASRHCWGLVECDGSRLIEGEIANTAVDFFLVGYPTASGNAASLAGTFRSAATLIRNLFGRRTLSGAFRTAAALARKLVVARPLSGLAYFAGSVIAAVAGATTVTVGGLFSSSAELFRKYIAVRSLTSTFRATGSLIKSFRGSRFESGTFGATATLSKYITKTLSSTFKTAGTLIRKLYGRRALSSNLHIRGNVSIPSTSLYYNGYVFIEPILGEILKFGMDVVARSASIVPGDFLFGTETGNAYMLVEAPIVLNIA